MAGIIYRNLGLGFVVLDKPTGVDTYSYVEEMAENVLALFAQAGQLATGRKKVDWPAAIHRLDKPTSGCLAVGVHSSGRRRLSSALQKGKIQKTYLAVVRGAMESKAGRIEDPLSEERFRNGDSGYSVVHIDREHGKPALTIFETLFSTGTHSLVQLTPMTGRTHQLRVHCAHRGHPIVGDPWYPGPEPQETPLHLHAFRLSICSNVMGRIDVTAALPAYMTLTLRQVTHALG